MGTTRRSCSWKPTPSACCQRSHEQTTSRQSLLRWKDSACETLTGAVELHMTPGELRAAVVCCEGDGQYQLHAKATLKSGMTVALSPDDNSCTMRFTLAALLELTRIFWSVRTLCRGTRQEAGTKLRLCSSSTTPFVTRPPTFMMKRRDTKLNMLH